MNKKQLSIVASLAVILLGMFFYETSFLDKRRRADLTFTNTAEWDAEFLVLREQKTQYADSLFETINLPPPPPNTSAETDDELQKLRDYKKLRTSAVRTAILAELNLNTTKFGDYTLGEYLDGEKFPATARLLRASHTDTSIIVMREKERFNRVRPSILDSEIEPIIAIPAHPAYPSGHSTQAYFFAQVLSVLMPERRDEFFARAHDIAFHREIAGVHYPSDTAVGMLLAEQIFTALQTDTEFNALLYEAGREWSSH